MAPSPLLAPDRRSWTNTWFVRAAVVLASAIPFLPLVKAWYGADDFYFVDRLTTGITSTWAGPWTIFVENLGTSGGFYRPLAMLSLFLDLRAGAGAWLPHAVNILLHASTALGVFELASRLTAGQRRSIWLPAFCAVAFAVFPRRVEAVAWVSCRPDLLATLLAILAARAACGLTPRAHWLSLALWAASLLSKESTALIPIALVVLRANAGPLGRRALFRDWLLPFAMVGVALLVVRRFVVGAWVGGYHDQRLLPGVGSFASAAKHAVYSFVPPIDALSDLLRDPSANRLVSGVVGCLLLGLVAGVVRWRAQPATRVGLVWFAAAVIPVIGFAPSLSSPLNDRLMYLPGVAIALALASVDWTSRRIGRWIMMATCVLMAALTFQRAQFWPLAGERTKLWVEQMKIVLRDTPAECRAYVAGGPDSLRGAYMLRSGWDWALAYVGERPAEGRVQPLALYFADATESPSIAAQFDSPDTVTIESVGHAPAVLPLAIPDLPGVTLLEIVPGGDRFGRVHRVRVRISEPGVVIGPSRTGPVIIGAVGRCLPHATSE